MIDIVVALHAWHYNRMDHYPFHVPIPHRVVALPSSFVSKMTCERMKGMWKRALLRASMDLLLDNLAAI